MGRLAAALVVSTAATIAALGVSAGADEASDQVRAAQLQLEIAGATQQILALKKSYDAEQWSVALLEARLQHSRAALGRARQLVADDRRRAEGAVVEAYITTETGPYGDAGRAFASSMRQLRHDRAQQAAQLAVISTQGRQLQADLAQSEKETRAAVTTELVEDQELAQVDQQLAADQAASAPLPATTAPRGSSGTSAPARTARSTPSVVAQAAQQAAQAQAPAEAWLASAGGVPPALVPTFEAAGTATGIPWTVLAAVAWHESRFEPQAIGVPVPQWCGGRAVGMMQFASSAYSGGCAPGTFETYEDPVPAGGADPPTPFDPTDAVWAAGRLLQASGGGGDLTAALEAYSGGDPSYPPAIEQIASDFASGTAPTS